MYFNNRNNPPVYGYGCSLFGCLLGLMALIFIVQGSFILLFRYFWLIVLLGVVVWAFRKWVQPNGSNQTKSDKHRNFEERKYTASDNIERDFEEVDDPEDEEQEKQ